MTLSDYRRITDELLSAYIDDEVSEQERALIEAAILTDEEIAWRVESLRQTVSLLQGLPELPLPRAFTLTLDQARIAQSDGQFERVIADAPAMEPAGIAEPVPAVRSMPKVPVPKPAVPKTNVDPGFWEQLGQGWREFWQAGNPILRNAAAVSFALMLMLIGAGPLLTRSLTQPMGMAATTAPAAAPAEVVALVPTASPVAPEASQPTVTANKQPAEENARIATLDAAPVATVEATGEAAADAASARVLQSDEAEEDVPASEEPTSEEPAAVAAASAVTEESAVVEEAEAAVAEAAPTEQEPQVAAAAVAPPQSMPPGDANMPFARGGGGGPESGMQGGDGMGGGMGEPGVEMAPAPPGSDTGLLPQQAYGFDAEPVPAEEAVTASVAAASPEEESAPEGEVPAAEAPASEEPADMAATPAVDAPVAATAPAATEAADEATISTTAESGAIQATGSETKPETAASTSDESTSNQPEPVTTEPTAEVVALAAPESITNSTVVQDVRSDETVTAKSVGIALPIVWVAQGGTLLLTIMLASLWWRSRTPRRPNPDL